MDAINKAFEILDVFIRNEDALNISEISRLAGVSSSTAHRITSILIKRGYIEQTQKRGKYFLSNKKLVDLASVVKKRLKIRNVALPYLQELSQAVDEAVELSGRRGNFAYNIEVIHSDRLLDIRPDASTFNLYNTGVGKVFLAYMTDKKFQDYINGTILKPRTPNTITDIGELREHLKKVREDGVAFDDEEHETGVRMVASPVRDWDGNIIAAIGVLGPSIRISKQRMIDLAPEVKKCAEQISQAMGYPVETQA
jgi:IclR family KDG regulon transcriptional repressor